MEAVSNHRDQNAVGDTIRIRGVDVPISTMMIPQVDLRFFVDNPRVYTVLRTDGAEPSQVEIQKRLQEMDHVKALIQDIRLNGGLTDAVIVKSSSLEVLEGNSRLAAYRVLYKSDPVRWGKIKCTLLPKDIDESLVFALLGQYHITGKKDWAPFEQAGFLYRRSVVHEVDAAQLAREVGLTKAKVEHLVATYKFMGTHDDTDPTRWSYYDEYLKSRAVRKARLGDHRLDSLVVNKIKSGEIPRAVDVRDRLPVICSAPNVLKRFIRGKYDFEDAHESAVVSGADSAAYKRLSKFRLWIAKSDVVTALAQTQGEARKKIEYELGKIARCVDSARNQLRTKG